MRSEPRRVLRFAALGLVTAAGACSVWRAVMPSAGPPPRPFNHEAHLLRGPDCLACHEGTDKQAPGAMPTKDFCMVCHEDLDKDPKKPPENKVAIYLDEKGEPTWSRFTKQIPDIKFSHQTHAAKGVACTVCHVGIDKDKGLLPGMVQRMESCRACHEKQAPAKNECATCHTSIDRNSPPPSHLLLWDRLHGACARQGREVATGNDCALCHRSDACVTCHQTRPPADHNEFWRLRGHGAASTVDRSRCQTCHASDSCVRCHQETAPVSHRAGWNAPRDGHCAGCHLPLQTSGRCYVCHKTAPGHAAAPPKPAWHNAGMNCRSCHAATLRHPDSGDNCNSCHR